MESKHNPVDEQTCHTESCSSCAHCIHHRDRKETYLECELVPFYDGGFVRVSPSDYCTDYKYGQWQGTKTKAVRFKAITERMNDVFLKKNHDYGDAYKQIIDRLGYGPVVGRIFEKYCRIEQMLVKKESPMVDESVSETIIDAANTLICLAVELEERRLS